MTACSSAASAPPPRIVLVDDDEEVRAMLAETLREWGYAVSQAASAEQALALLSAMTSVQMVISDVRMPGMSGLDLAELIKRERPGTKIILISGYFHPQPVSQRFLMKPFRLHELASAVQAELS